MTLQTAQLWLRRLASVSLACGAVNLGFALGHWRELTEYGQICGASASHCPACPLSVAFLMLAAILWAEGVRRPAAPGATYV